MQTARINSKGLNLIANALGLFHKLGKEHFTPSMLNAWAAEAEESFANGNGMSFEIKGRDTLSGRPEIVTISPDGYEIECLNDE
jgi:hypothetical protein